MRLLLSPLTWALAGLLLMAISRGRFRPALRRVAALLLGAGGLAMTPLGANLILRQLEARAQAAERAPACQAPGPRQLVLLGGGLQRPARDAADTASMSLASFTRSAHALALYRQGGIDQIVVSGGPYLRGASEADVMSHWLAQAGVPPAALRRENGSQTTWENAQAVAALLGRDQPVLLVTTAMHMPRALMAFEFAQLRVCAAPTQWQHVPPRLSPGLLWPQVSSLDKTERALHEWAGLLVYRLRTR